MTIKEYKQEFITLYEQLYREHAIMPNIHIFSLPKEDSEEIETHCRVNLNEL